MPNNTLYTTLNGERVVTASVTVPYYGIWAADVSLAQTDIVTSPCTLILGNLTLTGSIFRTNTFAGTRSVRLVGGGGGWRQLVPAQGYANPVGIKLSLVMNDVCKLIGETINIPAANDALIGTYFVRENAQAQRMLRQLVGYLWWMDLSGVTQIVPRTSAQITSDFLVNKYNTAEGRVSVATEDLASWMPANTFISPTLGGTLTISSSRFVSDNKGTLRVEALTVP